VSDEQRSASRTEKPPAERSCPWCDLARWWGGLTRCEHCGWVWDGKTPRGMTENPGLRPPRSGTGQHSRQER
jgi:rubredoxin